MSVYGSLPPPRVDQLISAGGGELVPPSQPGVFIGRLVVINSTGPGTGLFMYNGTGSATNPPILAITTASTDPYGNATTPLAIAANLPFLLYNGVPGPNTLIAAFAPASGTDAFLTAYPGPGFALQTRIGTPPSFTNWVTTSCSPTLNALQFVTGQDGNLYSTGILHLISANSIQSVTSTTPATITNCSCQVFPGRYRVIIDCSCQQGGGAFAVGFQVAGPAITFMTGYTFMFVEGAPPALWSANHHGSLPTSVTGPAFAALAQFIVKVELEINFSAQGTLAAQVFQGVSGHQFTVPASGCRMDVYPCN